MINLKSIFILLALCFVGLAFYFELQKDTKHNDEPTISFWQYWQGEEREPINDLVSKFNQENHGFKVEMLTISLPRKKILMAITGGVAPDLVHLDGDMVADFANRNALADLNDFIKSEQPDHAKQKRSYIHKNKFIPIYMEMLNIKNSQWAIPLMPTCEAMHINKALLKEAGIKRAPQSLEELKNLFNKATDFDDFSKIGWLPSWPPWTGRFINSIFGGSWGRLDSQGKLIITANSKENIAAWTWVQENFARKIPKNKLQAFTEGFSAYQSPDNPFYTGRIAVENNGVWEKHLAKKFAPKLDIEILPFPGSKKLATLVTVDALAIPRGARHPELAAQFINWLTKQKNLEYLANAQHKFTPIKTISKDFIKNHPNPYIQTFIDLAKSPNAVYFPPIPLVQKYRREIKAAYNRVVRLEQNPKDALDQIQATMEQAINAIPQS